MKLTQKRIEHIEEICNHIDNLDCAYCLGSEGEEMDFSEFNDNVDRYINENSDIIYYSNAITFLSENDPSLNLSLSLADDMGYTPGNLNSEILATLLNAENIRDEYCEVQGEIKEYFEECEEAVTAELDGKNLVAECSECGCLDGYVSTGEHEESGEDIVHCQYCGHEFNIEW